MPEYEHEYDASYPWILNKMISVSERLLASQKNANILIIVLVLLTLLPAFGIGIVVTRAAAPATAERSAN